MLFGAKRGITPGKNYAIYAGKNLAPNTATVKSSMDVTVSWGSATVIKYAHSVKARHSPSEKAVITEGDAWYITYASITSGWRHDSVMGTRPGVVKGGVVMIIVCVVASMDWSEEVVAGVRCSPI